jgi:hypothetical protein
MTSLIDVATPPAIAASIQARGSKRNRSQNVVIGAGLVSLCLLTGFLVWFSGDHSDEIVRSDPEQSADKDESGMADTKPVPQSNEPFVLEQDGRRLRFRDLFAACDQARDDAIIHLDFDGERETRQATIRRRITLVAGWNSQEKRPYRPVLKRDLFDITNGVRALLQIDASARLEGIEIRYESEFNEQQRRNMSLVQLLEWAILCQNSARLELLNCRLRMEPGATHQFVVKADRGSDVSIKNCEFFGGTAVAIASSQNLTMENSLVLSPSTIVVLQQPGPGGSISISNCTFLNETFLKQNLGRAPRRAMRDTRIRFDVRNSILDSAKTLVSIKQLPGAVQPILPSEIDSLDIAATVVWGGTGNVYDVGRTFLSFTNSAENPPAVYELPPAGIVEWRRKWRGRDDTSRAATFRPAPGFEGFHEDLLGIEHSMELQLQLDGGLPPRDIGARRETIGTGEGYEKFLDEKADNDNERVE